jgi:hypothetical protein
MNIKLGQLRRWRGGTFKDGFFLVMSAGPHSYLIDEYGATRHVSRSAVMSSDLIDDVEI